MNTVVKTRSFARAGFLGNPSDGYFGKTISFAFSDFGVQLTLTESSRLRFVPGEVDDATFESPEQLVRDLRLCGYYGGIRLLKAVTKRFWEYCTRNGLTLPRRNFTASWRMPGCRSTARRRNSARPKRDSLTWASSAAEERLT